MNKLTAALKANRKKIVKAVVITSAVAVTIIVAGALYKANVDASEALALAESATE